jgi:opacity protein-like surface antigen
MKSIFLLIAAAMMGTASFAEGNQVFYRYGISSLDNSRSNQVFTDLNNTAGSNSGKQGWNISGGLDIQMLKDLGPGDLLGEVMVDYAHFSRSYVRSTAETLASSPQLSKVTVSELTVLIAPKYRLSYMDGKLRPWVIPVGLAFLVNSPPSNDSTYLDIGLQAGVGVEYAVLSALSVGIDYRHTFASKESGVDMSNSSMDLYVGINF